MYFEKRIRDGRVPEGAAFSVGAEDDVMEPYIKKGGTYYVGRECRLRPGDVGVFYLDGRLFCRQYAEDSEGNIYLFALNRARKDADLTVNAASGVQVVSLGRVILSETPPLPGYEIK